MFRRQINMHLPPEHPIILIWNNGIQDGRRIAEQSIGHFVNDIYDF